MKSPGKQKEARNRAAPGCRSKLEFPFHKEEKKKEPKEFIEDFLIRFRPKIITPKLDEPQPQVPAAPQKKIGAEHFTFSSGETPPVTPPRKLQGPPGLETREYPNLSPKVPPRHEGKAIAQNNLSIVIK